MRAESSKDLIARIDACLPQTQCTRCGYPDCRAYAEAIAGGHADINRCPPGDDATIQALAQLLAVPEKPLDTSCGPHSTRTRARIDEQVCIGCRKCIDACPVDAIIGARKLMHTVIADDCTGCELCLPPCPVNCISLIPVSLPDAIEGLWRDYTQAETGHWRTLAAARRARLTRGARARRRVARPEHSATHNTDDERARIRAEIRAAVERTRARKRPS
jgi:electron transport complex protein RnfB